MRIGHQDDPVPTEAGQQHESRKELAGTGGNGEVHAVGSYQFGQLFGGALVQLEVDFWVAFAEFPNDVRQHVARLGVGRRNGQGAFLFARQVAGEAPDILRLPHDAPGAGNHVPPRRGDGGQALPLAREELHAQFLLQQFQLFADPGLARVQALGSGRDIEATVRDGDQVLELLEGHGQWLYSHRLQEPVNRPFFFAASGGYRVRLANGDLRTCSTSRYSRPSRGNRASWSVVALLLNVKSRSCGRLGPG